MKTDKQTPDLEQLLDALEHDGRNARRQQRIADMIDQMAAEESAAAGRVRRLWAMRVAAAACVLFFIVTAVRVWFIPTGQVAEPQVAQAVVPVAVPDTVAAAPISLPATTAVAPRPRRVAVKKAVAKEDNAIEEFYADATQTVEEPQQEEPQPLATEPEEAAEPIAAPVEAIAQPIVSLKAEPELLAEAAPESRPSEPRRSLWQSLVRRSEPSRMDGTTLAINLL